MFSNLTSTVRNNPRLDLLSNTPALADLHRKSSLSNFKDHMFTNSACFFTRPFLPYHFELVTLALLLGHLERSCREATRVYSCLSLRSVSPRAVHQYPLHFTSLKHQTKASLKHQKRTSENLTCQKTHLTNLHLPSFQIVSPIPTSLNTSR